MLEPFVKEAITGRIYDILDLFSGFLIYDLFPVLVTVLNSVCEAHDLYFLVGFKILLLLGLLAKIRCMIQHTAVTLTEGHL